MEQQTSQPDEETPGNSTSMLDGAISIVKRYMANPAMVTPNTMQHLLNELESVKSYMDEEESQEETSKTDSGLMSKQDVQQENEQ